MSQGLLSEEQHAQRSVQEAPGRKEQKRMIQEERIKKYCFQDYLWASSKNFERLFRKWSAVIIVIVPKDSQT